jgi:hypothetical protein
MPNRLVLLAVAVAALSCVFAAPPPAPAALETWAFAVSGDSRDCGDLVMPKIAQAVLAERTPPMPPGRFRPR